MLIYIAITGISICLHCAGKRTIRLVSAVDMKIDYREKKLQKYFPDAEIVNLPVGDLVYREVCIERKAIGDFISSIIDRRLFNQAINMRENYNYPFILVEGDLKQISQHLFFTKSRIKISHVIGATCSLLTKHQVPVIFCSGTKYMVDIIKKIIEKYDQNDDKKIIVKPTKRDVDPRMQVLMSIKGIGVEKASKILKFYGSIGNINMESIPERVSKKDIQRILEVLK